MCSGNAFASHVSRSKGPWVIFERVQVYDLGPTAVHAYQSACLMNTLLSLLAIVIPGTVLRVHAGMNFCTFQRRKEHEYPSYQMQLFLGCTRKLYQEIALTISPPPPPHLFGSGRPGPDRARAAAFPIKASAGAG